MPKPSKIWDKVYEIGGPGISNPSDASVFLVDVGNKETVMIRSFDVLVNNIGICGFEPENLKALILTHCHIDHIGSTHHFKTQFDCQVIAHEKDAEAIEGKDIAKTAADWYGVEYVPVVLDVVLTQDFQTLKYGDVEFNCLHTPGHTPGSIAVYCDITDRRILFGQDIHGPFDESFGSDIEEWKKSMQKLLDLKADILCEGHFGIYRSKENVKRYIEGYLRRN
jgi:glyoxylase-like metal-dependent hydrolase (beta-lactamase superfamily II)